MGSSARTQQVPAIDPIARPDSEPPTPLEKTLERRDDGVRFFRGILIGVSLSVSFWIVVFLAVRFLR
jgi:hypothetical protein